MFSILCGFTIGEYIRNRRLSLAGTELATTDAKVIDVALKYGYESPDSFAKAFPKFQFEKIIIPQRTYAVFETEKQRMPIPEYFDIRKQIAAEWLSNEEYQMINTSELAVYHWGITNGYADRTIEIWIPIEKK